MKNKSTSYLEVFRANTKGEANTELKKSQYKGCVVEKRKEGGKIIWCIFYTIYK